MMIFSLVAMTGLENCCITSAYLQLLCHSGERPVARGPLVIFFYFFLFFNAIFYLPFFLHFCFLVVASLAVYGFSFPVASDHH